ncbi:hypothetical protein GQ43DRAFT_485253 [Delitschia confertaspora ATCC 74209]|uniref:Yeast cell wall synthesis Kre9/Knh1-like N-terminal domain-containing protein n=1 Tax=Delitschia confertaspora ATCC 74209 TaxID=1513339 RepID=A0A9P4MKK7_9PLEO|nr:hypothetical protein GQ43DRAFT_485253 [Delitschia confertaspora ATCC 74209]
MRFFSTILAGAALVASALALEINDYPKNPEAGKTYTVTYSPKDNTPTTFVLRKGQSGNLGTIGTLTTTATGGKFEWHVDPALVNAADYALEIKQAGSASNYIGPFPITGGRTASASTSASASASSSSASSASSASSLTSSPISSSAATSTHATTMTTSASRNGTATSTKASSTGSEATGSVTPGAPESTGAASVLGSSPFALVFGAVAAMAYLN